LYVILIVLGMCGVLFSRQLPNLTLQTIVVVVSVATPLIAIGRIARNIQAPAYQRAILVAGLVMLIIGALVISSGLPESMASFEDVSEVVIGVSRGLGLGSLLLGLLAVLVILVRRGEETEEVAQRFRYLAEHMSEGFILTGPDGTITLVNDALLKLTNLRSEELVGKQGEILAEEFELAPMLPHIDNRRQGIASEYHVTWKVNGEDRQLWVNGTPLFDRRGKFAGALATVRDVTEPHRLAKRLEKYTQGLQSLVEDRTQRLSKSQQRLRDLLMNMNEGFLTLDESYHIRFANSRICDLLLTASERLVGRDIFDFIDPSGRGRLLEVLENARSRRGYRQHQELVLSRPDGKAVPVVASIAPVAEAPDEDARYSLVLTDVSELKRMQHQLEVRAVELEEANAELRILDRAKDSFLSNVSHELRTPLSTIRGYVEMFHTGSLGDLSDTQVAGLKVMTRNVERLGTLIDEIIEFSRMEIRGVQIHYSLFSVRRLLQEAAASVKPQLLAKELTLEIRESDTVRRMWGDRKRVTQVMAILLSNAIKFSNKGGRITMGAEAVEATPGAVAIAVEDTGIGIDRESQKRVFDKFFQADSSRTRRYEGAGIGLSIAKSIMDAHGGSIDLRSKPNEGSTFTLLFPDSLFNDREVPDRTEQSGTATVLLVASDVELGSALRRVLEARAFDVTHVSTGFEAARLLDEMDPDFIVVNEESPALNPIGVVQYLNDRGIGDHAGVLVLSESSSLASEFPALRVKCPVDVLYKPFGAREFVSRLERLHEDPVYPLEDEVAKRAQDPGQVALLCISPDGDLQEWIETAVRRRDLTTVRASNVEEALAVIDERAPSAVLADLDVPERDVAILLGDVRVAARHAGCTFFVMTGLGEEDWKSGDVTGVLRKPFSTRELVDTVTAAVARSLATSSAIQ